MSLFYEVIHHNEFFFIVVHNESLQLLVIFTANNAQHILTYFDDIKYDEMIDWYFSLVVH